MFYSEVNMKKLVACVVLLIVSPALAATTQKSQYQQATIIRVEPKTSTRVLYYVVNTPITKDDPYFDVSVQLNDIAYMARYTPRHKNDDLPEEWKTGANIQAKVQGRHLFLKSEGEPEMELVIIKKKRVVEEENLAAAPAK
jgi:hypothetical protein